MPDRDASHSTYICPRYLVDQSAVLPLSFSSGSVLTWSLHTIVKPLVIYSPGAIFSPCIGKQVLKSIISFFQMELITFLSIIVRNTEISSMGLVGSMQVRLLCMIRPYYHHLYNLLNRNKPRLGVLDSVCIGAPSYLYRRIIPGTNGGVVFHHARYGYCLGRWRQRLRIY